MTTRSEGVAVMKASVKRKDSAFKHTVQVRDHQLTVDEPLGVWWRGCRPRPAGAACRESCLVYRDHDGDVCGT